MKGSGFHARAAVRIGSALAAATLAITMAPAAHAESPWGAIVTSPDGEHVGWAGGASDEGAAYAGARNVCGDAACTEGTVFTVPSGQNNWCAVLAKGDNTYVFGWGPTFQEASTDALSKRPGLNVKAGTCAVQ